MKYIQNQYNRQNIIINNFDIKMKSKTKKITKDQKKSSHKIQPLSFNEQPIQNNGQPILKNLSDFVTAITPVYVSKPIYTGGRILCGQNFIYASCNNEISIYSISQQVITQKIKHKNQEIINFAVDHNEKNIVTFSSNNLLRFINIKTQKVIHKVKINPKLYVYDISFSPDDKYIALGFASSIIKIYTVQTMKQTHSYKNHTLPVRKVEWHRSSQALQIISIDQDRNLVVFDYILNKVIAQVKQAGKNFVQTLKGTSLITSCDKSIKVFDFKSLKLQYSFDVDQYVDAMHYLQSGMLIFGGEETKVFNVDLNNPRHEIRHDVKCVDTGVLKILPISNRKQFIVVSAEQNLTIIQTNNLSTVETIIGFNDQIIDIKYSKGSRKSPNSSQFIILISNSNHAKIFSFPEMKLISFIQGHQDTILCCQYFHPYILTGGKDKIIKLHEIDPLGRTSLIANYRGHSEYVCGLGVMGDRKLAVSVSEDKTIKLWSLLHKTQHKIQIKNSLSTVTAHQKSINAIRVSPNQEFIATCSHDRTAKIWSHDLKLFFTLSSHKRGVWDAAFHPIEKLVVTVAGDGALKGWSLFNGECLWSLGEGFAIMRCQWIYHHQVVTTSIDGIVKIWDIRKQTSLSYDKHQGKIWALQVIKDQTDNKKVSIITGANDSTLLVWKDSTQQTRQQIMKTHQITQQQRIQYQQLIHQHKYILASKLAFTCNYSQLFITSLNKMFTTIPTFTQLTFQNDKLMIEQTQEQYKFVWDQEEFNCFVKELFQYDPTRLLNVMYVMTSTVRNYKAAQCLLLALMTNVPLKKIIQIQSQFSLVNRKQTDLEDLNSQKSQFQEFLQKMQIYTDKHINRLERYVRGTYYLDHLQQRQNMI